MTIKYPFLLLSFVILVCALYKHSTSNVKVGIVRYKDKQPYVNVIDFDLNSNGYLSEAEALEMFQMWFRAHDDQTMGSWTLEEAIDRSVNVHPKGSISPYKLEQISENVKKHFTNFDLDGDGIVSEQEFVQFNMENIMRMGNSNFSGRGIPLKTIR